MSNARKKLVTDVNDPAKTAQVIQRGVFAAIRTGRRQIAAGKATHLARLYEVSPDQVTYVVVLALFALGEVFERQFYPDNREDCAAVATELLAKLGLAMPDGLPRSAAE